MRFDEYGYGMVVADGLGPSGEAASRLAVSTLVDLAIHFGRWQVRIDEPIAEEVLDRARRFYQSVDAALVAVGRDSERRLRTTMTTVYTAGTALFFAHVGHSRAYLFRDRQLTQLTHDHTVQRTRARGPLIVDVAAASQDLHHVVTQTLGRTGPGASQIDLERFGLLHDDIILLCTNGLSDAIEDGQIAAALRAHSLPDEQCRALVDLAVAAGGRDDVTALVAHYRFPGD